MNIKFDEQTNIFDEQKNIINEQTNRINELINQNNELSGLQELIPLLEFVSKFRLKIIEQLIKNKKIPSKCTDWSSMFKFLEEKYEPKELRSIIDDEAGNLGLDYNHWQNLKITSSNINRYKHPEPLLSKEKAFLKIEKLIGTEYSGCYEPLKSLVDLFEKNEWN